MNSTCPGRRKALNPSPTKTPSHVKPVRAGCLAVTTQGDETVMLWCGQRWTRRGFAPLCHRLFGRFVQKELTTRMLVRACTVGELELISAGLESMLDDPMIPVTWKLTEDGAPIILADRAMQEQWLLAMPLVWDELSLRTSSPRTEREVFGLPKGTIDPGEKIFPAAVREFSEETGVPQGDVQRIASIAPVFHAQTQTMLYFVALPSVFTGKPGWVLSNPETSVAKWLTAVEIATVVGRSTAIKLEKDLFSKTGIAMNLLKNVVPPALR